MRIANSLALSLSLSIVLLFSCCVSGQEKEAGKETKDKKAKPAKSDKDVAKPEGPAVLLEGAMIHSMDGKAPFVGSVLIIGEKIKAVGEKVKAPKSTKRINLKGYHLTPGLIESRGKLWLTSLADRASDAKLDLSLGIDPWSKDWIELASQGITSVGVQPASGGTLGGYGMVTNVGPFETIDQIILKKQTGIQVSIGTSPGTSQSRIGQVKALEKLLAAAKKELDKEKDADKPPKPRDKDSKDSKDGKDSSDKGKEKEGTDKPDEKKDGKDDKDKADEKKSDKSKDDDKKEDDKKKKNETTIALKRVLKKEVPLHVEVHHADALKAIFALAKKYKFRLILDGLSTVDSAAEELQEADRPFVVGPFIESRTSPPAYVSDASRKWFAEEVGETGRLWAVSGFPTTSAIESRLLRCNAAMAVRHGASRDAAFAAITVNPARMLGISDHVGTIEAGKFANIAVFAGDPLNPATSVRMTMCKGKVTHDQDVKATKSVEKKSKDSTAVAELPKVLPSRYAIRSTRVLHRDGKLKPAMLLVDAGNLKVIKRKPKNTPVFDLGDSVVTPGLSNAWCTLGQTTTLWDSTESDATHLRAIDAVDPTTDASDELLQAGFVNLLIPPTTASTSSGLAGHLRLGVADYVTEASAASQFVFASAARQRNRFPASLSGQVEMLNKMMSGDVPATKFYVSSAVAKAIEQEKLDNIKAIQEGKRKAILIVGTEVELMSALKIAAKNKMKGGLATVGNGLRLGKYADKLKEQGLGVAIPQLLDNPFDARVHQYVELDRAGVPLVLIGEKPEAMRATMAILASAGVSSESLLKAVTVNAEAVGMKDTSFESGAVADLVVWSGNPLDFSSKAVHVVVDGKHAPKK